MRESGEDGKTCAIWLEHWLDQAERFLDEYEYRDDWNVRALLADVVAQLLGTKKETQCKTK